MAKVKTPSKSYHRSNSGNSSNVGSPSSASGINSYTGSNGINNRTVLIASLLQQLQGVFYSYELVDGVKLRPPPVSSLTTRHVTCNDVIKALSLAPTIITMDTKTSPERCRKANEIKMVIWKIAEWLRRLVEEKQATVTEVMETLRQVEVWISSLDHHHHPSSSGLGMGSYLKHSKTTNLIFQLLLPVLLSVQKRFVSMSEIERESLNYGDPVLLCSTEDISEEDMETIALTETGTLQLDWCLDAAIKDGERRNSVLLYGNKLFPSVIEDDDALMTGNSNNCGVLFGEYVSPKQLFGSGKDLNACKYLDVIVGKTSSDSALSSLKIDKLESIDQFEKCTKGTARACLELLSVTSLPLMVERLLGRLQAYPMHLTLLYISSSWHFTVISRKQRNATVSYLTGVCDYVIKHVERGAQRRTVMNILAKVFGRICDHSYSHANEWIKIPSKELESFWMVRQRIFVQARKWGRRKNSRIEAASLMQQLVSFAELDSSRSKQRLEVLDMLRQYVENTPLLRPASLQLIIRFMTTLTSSEEMFRSLPSDICREFSKFLALVCPSNPKKEPSRCEILVCSGVLAAAARSSGEKVLDELKRLLVHAKLPSSFRIVALSALALIVDEWRIEEPLKRKAEDLGVIIYKYLSTADGNPSYVFPALRCLRLLMQMKAPGSNKVIVAVGKLLACTKSSIQSQVAYKSLASCLLWIPHDCLVATLKYFIKALGRDPMCSNRKFIDLVNASLQILKRIIAMLQSSERSNSDDAIGNKEFRSTWIPLRLKMEGVIVLALCRQEEPTRAAVFELLHTLNHDEIRKIENYPRRNRLSGRADIRTYHDAHDVISGLTSSIRSDLDEKKDSFVVPVLADSFEPLLEFVKRCTLPPPDCCEGALMAVLANDGLFLHQIPVQWAWRRLSKIEVWKLIPKEETMYEIWKRQIKIVFTPMRSSWRSPQMSVNDISSQESGITVTGSELTKDNLSIDSKTLVWLSRNRMSKDDRVPLVVSGAWKTSQLSNTPIRCSEQLVLELSGLDVSLTDILVLELRSSTNSLDSSLPRTLSRSGRRKNKLTIAEQELQQAESLRSSFHYNLNVLSVLSNIFSRLSAEEYWSDNEHDIHQASRTCLEELVGIWIKQTTSSILRFVPIKTRIAIMTLIRCYLRFLRVKHLPTSEDLNSNDNSSTRDHVVCDKKEETPIASSSHDDMESLRHDEQEDLVSALEVLPREANGLYDKRTQNTIPEGTFTSITAPDLAYRESVIRVVSEQWAVGPHIDIDSNKVVGEASDDLMEQLMEGVLNVYEAVVCLGDISDKSLRERIHNFIRRQILTASRMETQAAASSALTYFLINNPSHLSHFVVGSLEVLRIHASWSAGTEMEQTLVYEHLRAIVRAAQAGKLTSSWSDTGTGYALLLLHLSAPILRHRRAALDLLSVLQRNDMPEDKVHQKGLSLQSARAAMLDSEYVSDGAYVEGSAIVADIISQMRPELAPAVLRELVRMQRLFPPQILPSILSVAIPWASALKDLISPKTKLHSQNSSEKLGDVESMIESPSEQTKEIRSTLTEEAHEVLDSAFALTSGCGIPPRHSSMLRSLWTGMINNSGQSAAGKVLVDFLLQLQPMSSKNGRSWHEDADTASVVLTLLLHSPMAMSIVRFLVLNLPHYGFDSGTQAVHDTSDRILNHTTSNNSTSGVQRIVDAIDEEVNADDINEDENDADEEDVDHDDQSSADGKDIVDDDVDEDENVGTSDQENSPGDERLSVITSGDNYAGVIWGGCRQLKTGFKDEKAGVVFFLLKAAAHTHAKLLVPRLHLILQYAAVQTIANPLYGPEAAVFLIRVLHLLVLRSKLRSGSEELAWNFIKSYLNDLWGSDDLTKNEQLDLSQSIGVKSIGISTDFKFTSTVVMKLSDALKDVCPSLKWNWNVLALAGATYAESRPEVIAGLTVFAGLGGAQTLDQLMQWARIVHSGVMLEEEEVVFKAIEGLSETFNSETKGSLVSNHEEQILQVRPFWDLALGVAVALLTSSSMKLYSVAARLALRLLRLTHIPLEGQNLSKSPARATSVLGSGDSEDELTLGPQDTRLVVMFGICPVVSIPPDVLLATLIERGLFALYSRSEVEGDPDIEAQCSTLSINILKEMWDVSAGAGDVDNNLMVLQIVVTSLRIVENLLKHSEVIQTTFVSEDKRASDALRCAGDAANDAVLMIRKSGFALDDMLSLFSKVSKYASDSSHSESPEQAIQNALIEDHNLSSVPSPKVFCKEFVQSLCLSLPQTSTWTYILSVLLQMVESGPVGLRYPGLLFIPIILQEKMHIWSREDFTRLANTLHSLGRQPSDNCSFDRCNVDFRYQIDSIRLILFKHADRSLAIDVFNVINEVCSKAIESDSSSGEKIIQTPSELSCRRRGGHLAALDDCSKSIWENFVFAVSENGDHVCTPTYKPKYYGSGDSDHQNDHSTISPNGTGTMDSSKHNSLHNSNNTGFEESNGGSKENSIRERSDSNTGEFETPASASPNLKAYPYGDNMHFPIDKYGSLRLGTLRLRKAFAFDASSMSTSNDLDDDDDDDVYEMESAVGRAPA